MVSTSRLRSQRFHDDCFEMLQPGGIVVVNLHYGHASYAIHVGRIRRSFKDAVLVIDDGELSIVFACKGHALDQYRPGAVRRPKNLESAAAEQLLAALALVTLGVEGSEPLVVRESHVIHVRCACNVIAGQPAEDPWSSRPHG